MKELGRVTFVQIQQSPMKVHVSATKREYRPDPLLRVQRLLLTADGILGYTASGERIMDVHHVAHPQTRSRGDNSVSLGLLTHYSSLRSRFGPHMQDGVAGENILITVNPGADPGPVPSRIFLESSVDFQLIELTAVQPAPPCVEFSRFALNRESGPEEIRQTLQFLEGGRRGYYAALVEQDCQCFVQAGDRLLFA